MGLVPSPLVIRRFGVLREARATFSGVLKGKMWLLTEEY